MIEDEPGEDPECVCHGKVSFPVDYMRLYNYCDNETVYSTDSEDDDSRWEDSTSAMRREESNIDKILNKFKSNTRRAKELWKSTAKLGELPITEIITRKMSAAILEKVRRANAIEKRVSPEELVKKKGGKGAAKSGGGSGSDIDEIQKVFKAATDPIMHQLGAMSQALVNLQQEMNDFKSRDNVSS